MAKHFIFDLETLGKSTESIVLSAAIVHFDLTEKVSYQELLDRTLLVKFSVAEQRQMGRNINKGTVQWWSEQSKTAQQKSFIPSKNDLTVREGLCYITEYVDTHGDKGSLCWTRGNFDQLITESLFMSVDMKPAIHFNKYMDIRTALRLMKESTNSTGYCTVPDFDDSIVDKHDPIHDVCYDVYQILYGD